MKKLLWHSNAPWAPTGYGQQTGAFAPYLAEHYDLAISCFYGLEGARLVWHGVPCFPGIGQDFGNIYLVHHAKDHFGGDPKGGIVVTLTDVWVFDPDVMNALNVACWTPVDHEPPPPNVIGFFQKAGVVPIAMSEFGHDQLRNYDLDPLYVPHGIDTTTLSPQDRDAVREETGIPKDAYLVGMVAANKGAPSRKGFQYAFQAFYHFKKRHPEALLYIHGVADRRIAAGEDLRMMGRALGIEESLIFANPYRMMYDPYPPSQMAQILSTFDVLINPSLGEGFGIPVLEAAACGVPSIVTNFSAMPQVAGPSPWKVGCRPLWGLGRSWFGQPDVDELIYSLEQSYAQSAEDRAKLSDAVRAHALEYDVRKVAEDHMLPALREVERRFDREPEVEAPVLVQGARV